MDKGKIVQRSYSNRENNAKLFNVDNDQDLIAFYLFRQLILFHSQFDETGLLKHIVSSGMLEFA